MHFNPTKGESSAVENLQQPHVKQKTPERQRRQTLGKGEQNGSKLDNSNRSTSQKFVDPVPLWQSVLLDSEKWLQARLADPAEDPIQVPHPESMEIPIQSI